MYLHGAVELTFGMADVTMWEEIKKKDPLFELGSNRGFFAQKLSPAED
jgi:hypothetical protein